MLKKRIIPCLDVKDGQTVKGVNFVDLRLVGDPVTLAKKYANEGADELVFLDISATLENRQTMYKWVRKIAVELNIPFTVGGGISTLEQAKNVINAGADKISINSAAIKNPFLITQIAQEFGSQCVVIAIDANYCNDQWFVYTNGGTQKTNWLVLDWALKVQELGAGEILLTSMANDGTKNGFAIPLLHELEQVVKIPIIASGGAGSEQDFIDLFSQTNISAALAASVFHDGLISIQTLKNKLKQTKLPIR